MSDAEHSSDTREAIMEATYRALCSHGYAKLTMQDIADEFEKSKSLLHYHFDTKEELLVAFIDHLLERFAERVALHEDEDPETRLRSFVDWFVFGPEDGEREAFHVALLELRSQAPFNDRYREQLRRSDTLVRTALTEIVRDGIENGRFRECDAEQVAALCFATMDGARTRQITLGESGYAADIREALYEHVIDDLVVADADETDVDETNADRDTDGDTSNASGRA